MRKMLLQIFIRIQLLCSSTNQHVFEVKNEALEWKEFYPKDEIYGKKGNFSLKTVRESMERKETFR